MSDANCDVEGLYDDDEENDFDEALMEELWWRRTEMTEMKEQIKLLRKERDQRDKALQERDQARRMYCTCMESPTRTSGTPAADTARLWEWDCFEEAIKP